MKLHVEVSLPHDEEGQLDVDINDFTDIDKIGARVGSAARRWLRSVPMRKGTQVTTIRLAATFNEAEPKARRNGTRRRKKETAASGESES